MLLERRVVRAEAKASKALTKPPGSYLEAAERSRDAQKQHLYRERKWLRNLFSTYQYPFEMSSLATVLSEIPDESLMAEVFDTKEFTAK